MANIQFGTGEQVFTPARIYGTWKSPIFDGFMSCIPGCPPPVEITDYIVYDGCDTDTVPLPVLACGGDIVFEQTCPYPHTKKINFHRIVGCVHVSCAEAPVQKVYKLVCKPDAECCEDKEITSVTIKQFSGCEQEAYEKTYMFTGTCGCEKTCTERVAYIVNKINNDPQSIVNSGVGEDGSLLIQAKVAGVDFIVAGYSGFYSADVITPNVSGYGRGSDLLLAGFPQSCITAASNYKLYSITYWDFMDITQNGLQGGSYGNNPLGHNKGVTFKTAWVAFSTTNDDCDAYEEELCYILSFTKEPADYFSKLVSCDCVSTAAVYQYCVKRADDGDAAALTVIQSQYTGVAGLGWTAATRTSTQLENGSNYSYYTVYSSNPSLAAAVPGDIVTQGACGEDDLNATTTTSP